VDYGPAGRQAVAELLDRAYAARLIPARIDVRFIAANPSA
jgi:hypothetical protein